jgi:hypothetical protein
LGVFVVVLLALGSGAARGEVIAPISATASSQYQSFTPAKTRDGSGLTGTGYTATHNGTPPETAYHWHSDLNSVISNQWIQFDLGGEYDITDALIWQMNQQYNTWRGIKYYSIEVAGADQVFSVYAVSNLLNQATDVGAEAVQVATLEVANIRYVRFDIHENWSGNDTSIVGLSEVRFDVEPARTDGTVLAPAVANASGTYFASDVDYLIDGSGLTGTGIAATHTNQTSTTSWTTMWMANGDVAADEWVEFDLGREYTLISSAIWQYNQVGNLGRCLKAFTIYTAGSDKSYTRHGQRYLAQAGGTTTEPSQLVRLEQGGVQWVKFDVDASWGDSAWVGLSEVRFLWIPTGTVVAIK